MDTTLTLLDLNSLVRGCLEQGMPGEYWVQAELSDVHTHSNGHCYLEFVQKEEYGNRLVARARGIIWANVFRMLRPYFEESTGQLFASGIKVQVLVSVSFHELYGYSLTVLDIDPTYTLGDMARRRRDILNQLQQEGVLTLNKELAMPRLPQRIAVVSSATAAGYGDFCHQLQHNDRGFYFHTELFPALMQGERVEESILAALDAINDRLQEFDVVVMIRGGGATSDLSCFDTYLLAAACAQFPLPVIVGIGHERDETVLDTVAHTRVKTPTAAAAYLIGLLEQEAQQIEVLAHCLEAGVRHRLAMEQVRQERLVSRLHERVRSRLRQEQYLLQQAQARIPAAAYHRLSDGRLTLLTLRKDLAQSLKNRFATQRHRIDLLRQRLVDASPERLLARGYSITLKEGRAVKDASTLQPGDVIVTRLYRGEIRSTLLPQENKLV